MPASKSSTQNVQVDAHSTNHSVSPLSLRERFRVRGFFTAQKQAAKHPSDSINIFA
jgi:hypothetical protein